MNTPDTPTPIADLTLHDFLRELAAKSPAPGGGAVAAATAATAAALARMVVAYSRNKKSLADHHELLEETDHHLARAQSLFLRLADEDAAAYAELNALQRTPDAPKDQLRAAALAAATPPLATTAACAELAALIEHLATRSNPWLRSDLAIAADLAATAARAAHHNVAANIPSLRDAGADQGVQHQADAALRDAEAAASRTIDACRAGW